MRPAAGLAATVAALPYDVYSRKEAKAVVRANPKSFLAVDRAETQFDDDVDISDERVYERAARLLRERIAAGDFVRESEACYFVYELTMQKRTQTGIVACAGIDDYLSGVIRKHENTRADKEADRIRHVDACGAQTGPIFLAYRRNAVVSAAAERAKKQEPLYDFTSEDGVRHRVFAIRNRDEIRVILEAFSEIKEIYIADGHHRAASAVKAGLMRRQRGAYTGSEPFNDFLSVLFPGDELLIMDYNRVVADLNGLDASAFLAKLAELFDVERLTEGALAQSGADESAVRPRKKGEFSVFLDGRWYRCAMRPTDIPDDPVESLDVSVLQNRLLGPVLGIGDPRRDRRIGFVGGIRGMAELERRCGLDAAAAFAMYPTTVAELFAVADAGRLMPPKSTWFEPKLRSGLFIHEI